MGSLKSRIKTRIPALRWRDEQLAKHARRIKELREKNSALRATNRALRAQLEAAKGSAAPGTGGASPTAGGGLVSWRVTLSGSAVQGVGFRQWITKRAVDENVDGWVRNRSDGKVEALLYGHTSDVARLYALLHQGPRSADVERVSSRGVDTRAQPGFRIRDDRVV